MSIAMSMRVLSGIQPAGHLNREHRFWWSTGPHPDPRVDYECGGRLVASGTIEACLAAYRLMTL